MTRIRPPSPPDGQLVPQEPNSTTGNPIPFPANFSFPFFRLPPEVRWKIYRLLFKATIPVYPTVPSNTYPAHATLERTSFPTNFLQISVQVEAEASEVLWGENQIVLQFPLEWNETRRSSQWYARSSTFIPKQRHLQRIRDLVIEVYLFRQAYKGTPANILPRPATAVKRELQQFCDSIGDEHHLQNVGIRFTNVKTAHNPNEVLAEWPPLKHSSEHPYPWRGCCFNDRGCGFGRTGLSRDELEGLCRQSIDLDQQLLLPLAALRGIPKVTVIGRVTPELLAYLQVCMSSESGVAIESFVH